MAHVAAGRVVQFDLLQVELGVGKPVKIADMVVVHMCEHDVLDGIAVDADQRERLDRTAQKPPLARRGDLGGKAGVGDDGMMRGDRDPHEKVHRHRAVMRVAADEMLGSPRAAPGVTDRVALVFGALAGLSCARASATHGEPHVTRRPVPPSECVAPPPASSETPWPPVPPATRPPADGTTLAIGTRLATTPLRVTDDYAEEYLRTLRETAPLFAR